MAKIEDNPTHEQIVSGLIANVEGLGKKILCCARKSQVEEIYQAIMQRLEEVDEQYPSPPSNSWYSRAGAGV